MNRFACMMLVALFLPATHASVDVAAQREALRQAYAANDGEKMKTAANALLAEFAGHPTYLFYLARSEAMLGNDKAALATLRDIVTRGVDMTHNAIEDPAFENVRSLPGFDVLKAETARLHEPIGDAETITSFGPADAMPEGVVVNGDRIFISSVHRGSVLVRSADGSIAEWPTPGYWSAQGIRLAADGATLWVATSAMNVSANAADNDRGRTALVAFDTDNGNVLARHVFPGEGEHVLGDFLFLDESTILATDSIGGGVHALDVRSGNFTTVVAPGTLRSPQGLARLADIVFVADYGNGLYRLDPSTGGIKRVADGVAAPYGIDGLYEHDGDLVAIQNGVRPQQVTRFRLNAQRDTIVSRKTLLANHAAFDEPTLGQVGGDTLYLVANSHWNRVDRDGKLSEDGLEPPVILFLPLRRMSKP